MTKPGSSCSPTALEQALAMVSCLDDDLPYSPVAERLVRVSTELADNPFALSLRTLVCYQLFHATERVLQGDEDPVPGFCAALQEATKLLEAGLSARHAFTDVGTAEFESVEEETGSHYGNLFKTFDEEHFFGEAARLLRTRFEHNGFDFSFPSGKRALDAGCGGGRYSVALKRLGFAEVVGVDYSEEAIASANERLELAGIEQVSFERGDVLDLPFADACFDFVFSNGVLHHTRDMERGVMELLRVLKRNGRGFIYLIEKPGGIFWDVIEILRPVMRPVPYELARQQFAVLGVPPNRRFYVLDHIMVPINIRSTAENVRALLESAGAVDIRRLTRGTDFDRVEQKHCQVPFHDVKYGIGENRFFFSKPEAA